MNNQDGKFYLVDRICLEHAREPFDAFVESDRLMPRTHPRPGRIASRRVRLSVFAGLIIALLAAAVTPVAAAPVLASKPAAVLAKHAEKPAAEARTTNAKKPAARVTFGVEPASAKGASALPYFSFGATPGAIAYDHVAVLNYSAVVLPLQLYATDATETTRGGFGLLPANVKPTGVGSWITIPPADASVRVPPATAGRPGQVVVPFVVRVSADATSGDHVGGIVASLRTLGTNATGQRIVLVLRIGSRVYVRVAGTLHPGLTVTDLQSSYNGTLDPLGQGSVTLSYVVTNTGNVDLGLDQAASMSGWLSGSRRVAMPHVALLIPGASVQESAVVNGVWPQFVVHASVSAQPIAPPTSGLPKLVSASASATVWAVPWTFLGIVVLLLAASVALLRRRSRRAARAELRTGRLVSA